jgi:hypothetical protein
MDRPMNMNHWNEFRCKFPAAAAWMDATDLQEEHKRLTAEAGRLREYEALKRFGSEDCKRLTWIEERLRELNALPMFSKGTAS